MLILSIKSQNRASYTMKLHLPVLLRKCLLSVLSAVAITSGTAVAGVMHSDVTMPTYTDFGQNKGRYVVGSAVNSLLQHIRDTEGGIGIEYTDGTQTYYLSNEQGMIDFVGVHDSGYCTLVSPTMVATVLHNGSLNGSFSANDIGEEHAQNYSVLDIRGSNKFRIMEEHGDDYMMQRQSRVVTDAVASAISTVEASTLAGQHMYHCGAGIMGMYDEDVDLITSLAWAYAFNIGDIDLLTGVNWNTETGQFGIYKEVGYGNGIGASLENPLPNATRGGDSGSPVFIYNAATGQYEYVASHQSGNGRSWGQARGNLIWAQKAVKSYDVAVDMANTNEVHLGAVTTPGETITDNMGNSTTLYSGTVTVGDKTVSFNGVKDGEFTWRDMNDIKDLQNWYAYDADRYNASSNADGKLNQSDADLFYTENLVFTAGQADNKIILDATVDMGAGYMEFNKGNQELAKYTITGAGKQLHTAGYVINEGVEVHLQLNNNSDYMTEWRKIGDGDLYIDGKGDTNALLNVGGKGATYLQQSDGYAAYNVLVNTGATIVIKDTNQIKRDLTFGAGGGVLDMNGNSMNWYTTNGSSPRSGSFTINALTDEAMITNSSSTAVTLTYKETGDTVYKGSFSDTTQGALSIDYQGGGTWTLHSIHTDLSHNAGSGLSVSNGKVVLVGTNTVHGTGSATGTNQQRYLNTRDWHYADATMDVTVKNGATFELGSHARLTGDVVVKQGGTFVMREGVQHEQEYIEGGTKLQNTADFADFYGLKGGVALDAGADMLVQYSEGTTAATTYGGNISGAGNVTIDLGSDEMTFILSGTNTFTGTKTITSGGLVARNLAALGNTTNNKWLVQKDGWIASRGFKEGVDILGYIDGKSTGTLALSHNLSTQLDLANHQGLFIGAESGKTVHYGEEGTNQSLAAQNGAWRLGGGGGELVVNFLLEGANNLILGAGEGSTGGVYLGNSGNSFSGTVDFNAAGMKLGYADGALGSSVVNLSYGNGLVLNQAADVARVASGAEGMLLLDKLGAEALDLSGLSSVALGASEDTTFRGSISLGSEGGYRFSTMNGATLRVASALDVNRNIVVDAQGTEGGTVVLAGNQYLAGDIQVMGSKDSAQGGSITLAAGQGMSLFGNVTLGAGTSLDVAGNAVYVFQGISGEGQVVDSRSSGSLYLVANNGNLNHSLSLNLATVHKTGANALNLSGSHGFGALYVDAGSLVLQNGFSTSRNSSIYLANGTSLNLQSGSIDTNIGMKAGAGSASLSIADNSTATLRGDIHLGSGSQLNMQANGGTLKLSGGTYGGENATLSVRAKELHFATSSGVDVLGTLSLENDMKLYSNGEATDMERNISKLQVNNNSRITLDERTWSTVWNIDALNGSGEILWTSNTTHETTSRLVLRGEGNFSGSISLNRGFENEERTHGAFIELAHDKAAQNASISLSGKSANAVASLAVNTKNAQIKGLSGNEHSYVYGGSAMSGAELMGDARPSSNRSATLTIDVDSGKSFTYDGTVGDGLSLNKTGAGTQSFTGTTTVNNITVQQGTLSLNAGKLNVRGDVGVGTGATLNMGDYTLNSGRTFSVLAGGSGSANFGGTLTLNGGRLSFSGDAMTGGTALNLGGLNTGSVTSQTVHFTDTSNLKAGQTYTLASGDWSSIYQNMSATGLHYYDATFGVNPSGNLQVSLTLKSNSYVWSASSYMVDWSNSKFGDNYASFNSGTTVVFDDGARVKYVGTLGCSVSIAAAVFNTSDAYTLVSYDGSAAKVKDLVIQGGGSVTFNGGICVTSTTTIEEGELILGNGCDDNTLKGTVTGAGTLVIDGAKNVAPTLRDLGTLRISKGSFSAASGALDVDQIIVDANGTYVHWHNYEGTITSNGGTLDIYSGSINGELVLNGNTVLVTNVTNSNDTFKLNSKITDNGYAIIQRATNANTRGIVDITTKSQAILNNYVVEQGVLMFTGGSHSGHGKITATQTGTLEIGGRANLSATNVHLSNGGTLDMKNQSTLMTDMTTSGAVSVLMGNESTYLKGSVTGSGKLAVSGQGVVQSLLSDSAEGALSLEVSGKAISLLAANTYSGGTTLNSGSLYARNSQALGTGAVTVNGGTLWLDISGLNALGSVSAVTLNSGAVLDISAATFSADTGLMLGGSLTVNEGAYINLGTLSTDNVKYTIFDLTSAGASAADWLNMQDRIMVNGSMLSTLSDWTLDLTSYGASLTFGTVLPDPLVWIGGESGIWNQTENNWDNTPKVPDDSMAFTNGDSVEFNTSATVQVAEGVEAANVSIGAGVDLALTGDLTVTGAILAGGDAFASTGNLTAEKVTVSSGTFEMAAGTKLTAESVNQKGGSLIIKGDADIAQLDVAAGLTTRLENETSAAGAQKNIDKLVLGKGATLEVYDKASDASATTLGTLQLNGETARIQDLHNSSHVVVETLNMNPTLGSATLSLEKNAASDKVSRFEFGSADAAAGNFKGRVELSVGNSNTNRPAAIIISGKDALSGAVVDLKSANSYIGLGINADNTTIAGLESGESVGSNAKLFSGTIGTYVKWDAQNTPNTISTTERTLNINTAAGSTHTFHGEVLSKLNLVKQGEGTQVFNGASNSFDGSLTVQNGTLKLGEQALGMLGTASAVSVNGGMLDISSATYSQNSGLALGGALQVNGGAVNLGSIGAAGSYTIFDLSAAGASASGWESWKDNLIVNGACLNRYAGASLSLTENAAQLSFSSMDTTNYSDMVWNGGEKGVWDQASSNWNRTSSGASDNIMFLNGDSVSFNSKADVTVAEGVSVNGLTIAEGAALTTHGAVAVTGTVTTGANSSWTLASGTNQSLTEAQLKNITSSLVVAEGATLTMTNKTTGQNNTTSAFNKVSGAGDVVLNLGNDNGIGVNTSNLTGDVIVASGRLQVNTSSFNAASTIRLESASSQLVFNGGDTNLQNDVVFQVADTHLHVNDGKTGTISGIISGDGGITKKGAGTLTLASQNTYKGATRIDGGKIILNTGGEYKLYNTISGGMLDVASGTTLANNGHAVSSALTLAEGSTWKVSADSSGVYTLNTSLTGTGAIQVVSGTTFKNNGRELLGTVTLDAGSKWVVSGTSNNTYTLNKNETVNRNVSGDGTMELASGTTVVVDGDNNKVLASNVAIVQNSTLRFNDAGGTGRSDMLDFNAPSKTISVAGGTLDFGNTRQTMGSWTLELSDGAQVTGTGGAYGSNRAAMDYNNASNNVIKATSGDSTISATTRLRYGSELKYEVARDASLNVSGLVHADGGKNGGVVKSGAGTLHLNNANNDLDSIVVSGGTANIHGAAAYDLATLQAATKVEVGFFAGVTKDKSTASKVTVSGSTLLGAGAVLNMSLTLAENSTLDMTGMTDSAGVTLNGALTFNGQVQMGTALLADVLALGKGESLLLFSGNGLSVSMGNTALTEVKVGEYFSNSALASMENCYVTYTNVGNVGSLVIVNVPEPTTTTLSLLALSALAARRRRK